MAGIVEGPFRFIVRIPGEVDPWPPMPLMFRIGADPIHRTGFFSGALEGTEEAEVLGPYLTRYTVKTYAGSRRILRQYTTRVAYFTPVVESPLITPVQVRWSDKAAFGEDDVSGPVKLYRYTWQTNENRLGGLLHAYLASGEKLLTGPIFQRSFATSGSFPYNYRYEFFVAHKGAGDPPPLILKNTGVGFIGSQVFTTDNILDPPGIVISKTLVSTEPGNSYRIVEEDNTAALRAEREAEAVALAQAPDDDFPYNDVVYNESLSRPQTGSNYWERIHRLAVTQDDLLGISWGSLRLGCLFSLGAWQVRTPANSFLAYSRTAIYPEKGIFSAYDSAEGSLFSEYSMFGWQFVASAFFSAVAGSPGDYKLLDGYTLVAARYRTQTTGMHTIEVLVSQGGVETWVEIFRSDATGRLPTLTMQRAKVVGSETLTWSYLPQDLAGEPTPALANSTWRFLDIVSKPLLFRRV